MTALLNPAPPVTHCRRGHPFDAANTARRRDGSRLCRACNAARSRGYYGEQRVASLYEKQGVLRFRRAKV